MTIRDEEILNASTVYHEEQFHCDGWNYDFIEGAKWADEHPRKGLVDIEKVIDYIYNHAHVRTFGDIVIDDMSVTEFIETMKKAMEE